MRIYNTILVAFIIAGVQLQAQTKYGAQTADDPTTEITVRDAINMTKATLSDIIELLDQKGYRLMGTTGTVTMNFDHINIDYTCDTFADNEFKWHIKVYQPNYSLDNIIEIDAPATAAIRWIHMLDNNGYGCISYQTNPKIFKGKGHGYDYIFQIHEDNAKRSITIRVQNQEKIVSFAKQQTRIIEKTIAEQLKMSKQEEESLQYLQAWNRTKATSSLFEPLKDSILSLAEGIQQRAINHYFNLLQQISNKGNDYNRALDYCDTIELFSPGNDTVRSIRDYLIRTMNGKYNNYASLCPAKHSLIINELSKYAEIVLTRHRNSRIQPLTLEFTFHTDSINKSSGKMYFQTNNLKGNTLKAYTYYNKRMQMMMDSISRLPAIQPVQKFGINQTTEELVIAKFYWMTTTTKIVDTCTPKTESYRPFLIKIEKDYFTRREYDPLEKEYRTRKVKPTKLNYTFSTTEKLCNGVKYVDVYLEDFNTPGYGSWIPSLFIPGLGTYLQGKHSYVIARALPFFLFGSLSAAGFIWENGKGKEIERPDIRDGNANYPWEYKNFGYFIGWGCAAISATIYLTDIIEGIATGARNMQLSKKIRKELKEGPIIMQSEPLDIEKTINTGK